MSGRDAALWVAIVIFVLLWGLPRVFMPLGTDQVYFALGARTILEGDQLYRDLWEIKPPLIYLLYAIPAAVAGEAVEAYRVLDFVNTMVAMAGVFALALRFFTKRAAFAAATVYGVSYLSLAGLGGLGQSESFMAAPLAFAMAAYPRPGEPGGHQRAVLAGVLLGVAFAVKFPAGLFFLGFVATELLYRNEDRLVSGPAVLRLTLAAAGLLIAQLPWLLYLLAGGVLDDFIEVQRLYTLPYTDLRWAPDHFGYVRFLVQAAADWFRHNPYLTVPAWVGLFLLLNQGRYQPFAFFAVLVGLGLLSVWWQGKLFVYHWLIMLPLMAPLAGHAVDVFLDFVKAQAQPRRWAMVAVVLTGFAGLASAAWLSTYDSYRYAAAYAFGQSTRQNLEFEYLVQLRENREIVAYVDANAQGDEGLYVWGFWTAPYLWSEQSSPSRFLTNSAVRADWSPEEWRRELIDDLEADPPRFFAVAAGDRQPWLVGSDETSDEHFCHGFPELRQIVDSQYEPVLRNDLYVLYDREAPQALVPTWCEDGMQNNGTPGDG